MIINPSLGGGVKGSGVHVATEAPDPNVTNVWIDTDDETGVGVDLSDYYTKEETNKLISNQNLLDNWYFADPIDQRGGYVVPPGTSYLYSDGTGSGVTTGYVKVDSFYNGYPVITADGKQATTGADTAVRGYAGADWGKTYSIDRWYLSVAALDVSTHKLTASANYGRIVQILDGTSLVGKTVTFSVRVHSITGGNLMIFGGPGDYGMVTVPSDFDGVVSTTVEVVDPEESYLSFSICLDTAGASAVIEAAKLELGSVQTLAHQDESGNWVLNEIPDYGEQLARCQRYLVDLNPYRQLVPIIGSAHIDSGHMWVSIPLPVSMRTTPVITGINDSIIVSDGTGSSEITVQSDIRMSAGMITISAYGAVNRSGIAYLLSGGGLTVPTALLSAEL